MNQLGNQSENRTGTYVRVAIPAPLYQVFDYRLPEHLRNETLLPGIRLKVPFGRTSKIGVLLEQTPETRFDTARIRDISTCLDQQPVLDRHLLDLLQWAADYYHYPVGEVINAALPVLLRKGQPPSAGTVRVFRLSDHALSIDDHGLARAPKQKALFDMIRQTQQGLDDRSQKDFYKTWGTALKALIEKNLVTVTEHQLESAPAETTTQAVEAPLQLNEAQSDALSVLNNNSHCFFPALLFGETGSGKTEVYLQFIDHLLKQKRQVLILVPEIGLTPQLVERFRKRFAQNLVVSHSGLTDRERLDAWLAARSGQAGVILGTRSALFTPLAAPGAIIVDEEHDLSFKQHEGFRYSARDVAIRRAQMLDIPVLLGSATPSLESMHNCDHGRYQLLRLPARAGNANKPDIRLVDIRGQKLDNGLSAQLLDAVQHEVSHHNQVLLFLNRRGFAPTLLCHDCGWTAQCRRCDARLTWHAGIAKLRCHHCGSEQLPPDHCPECNSKELFHYGQGTERIEQALSARFDSSSIVRIDRDTTRRKGAMDQKLDSIHSGAASILIGTQMLAKGHHFPNVTLVGIIDSDQGLYSADFRSSERMSQLILQVAGRAGRADKHGQVLVQTHHPEHPLMQMLVEQDYDKIRSTLLQEREAANLPPFSFMALVRAESVQPEAAMTFLEQAADIGRSLSAECSGIEIYGPIPAPMARRAGKYRAQLMIMNNQRRELHQWIHRWLPQISESGTSRQVRWSLDIDPQDVM